MSKALNLNQVWNPEAADFQRDKTFQQSVIHPSRDSKTAKNKAKKAPNTKRKLSMQ